MMVIATIALLVTRFHVVEMEVAIPAIGVFIINSTYEDAPLMIRSSYVTVVRSAGARVVPIHTDADEQYWEYMYQRLNGVLFPGDSGSLVGVPYERAARFFLKKSIDSKGDFPILAMCYGIQMLSYLVDPAVELQNFDSMLYTAPLHLTEGAGTRLFSGLTPLQRRQFTSSNVTIHLHNSGISTSSWRNSSKLNDFFRLTSTNKDREGKEFISTIEARNAPIYGIQYHPEAWLESGKVYGPWSDIHIEFTHFVYGFFIRLAAGNSHSVPLSELARLDIANTPPTIKPSDSDMPYLVYFFPPYQRRRRGHLGTNESPESYGLNGWTSQLFSSNSVQQKTLTVLHLLTASLFV